MKKMILFFTLLLSVFGVIAGCGTSDNANGDGNTGDGNTEKQNVVIGYFPNINHVPAMIAKAKGYYQEQLGDNVNIEYRTFPDGASFMTALQTGDIHAGLVGPGPAMNAYSNGADVKVIGAGSTGGTVIMARKDSGIETIEDIAGKTFISPRVGCTHDVQFETYMKELGIESDRIGGTMKHVTGKPSQYAAMFEQGRVDVATAPEPWASVLAAEVGAKVIIPHDEVSFGTTLPASVLVATGSLIEEQPELVQEIVNAHKQATEFIANNPDEAKEITIQDIKEITNQELSRDIIDSAWERIGFTYVADQEAIQAFADSSYNLNFLKSKPDFSEFIAGQFTAE